MRRQLMIGALAGGVAVVMLGAQSHALLTELDEQQVEEAVQLGMENFDQHPTAFKWDWYHDEGYGFPKALLKTEYLVVADFVRRSEFQRVFGSQAAHELTPEAIEEQRKSVEGVLQFEVTGYGETAETAEKYSFHLVANDKKIKPSDVVRPVEAASSGFTGRVKYEAQMIVEFLLEEINPDGEVVLVIEPPEGMGPPLARNDPYHFSFDLASLK